MSRGSAFGDIDNDGDIDIMVSNNNGKVRPTNEGDHKNNWIGFELEGRTCNKQAIGSKIIISTDSGDQAAWVNPAGSYLTSNDTRVVFGINSDRFVKSISIDWPGSGKETFKELKLNYHKMIIQGVSISTISSGM